MKKTQRLVDECGFGLMMKLIYFHVAEPDFCCFWPLVDCRPIRENSSPNCVFRDNANCL